VAELEAAAAAAQEQGAACKSQLQQQLAATATEASELRAALAAAVQEKDALQEELGEAAGERQRLEGKVQKHKQASGWLGRRPWKGEGALEESAACPFQCLLALVCLPLMMPAH
jgi:chromosome segregation ATPase